MLPEVQLLCKALLQRKGITAAAPGLRLKGVAFAPELQVCCHPSAMHSSASAPMRGRNVTT